MSLSEYGYLLLERLDEAAETFDEFDEDDIAFDEDNHEKGESEVYEPVTQPAMTRQAWAAACIEKITGVEICQDEPVTQPPATTGDDRIIVSVSPNPKRQGSAAYDRYQRYQAGITVETAIARGVTRADIRYDLKRGFIALG